MISQSKFHIFTTTGRWEPFKPRSTNFERSPKTQKYENDSSEGWKGTDSIPYGTAPAQYFAVSKHTFLKKNIQVP